MSAQGAITRQGVLSSLGEKASDLGYAAGWAVVRALPEQLARALFRAGADVAARRQGPDSQLRRNLARVLGVAPAEVPDELIRDSQQQYHQLDSGEYRKRPFR